MQVHEKDANEKRRKHEVKRKKRRNQREKEVETKEKKLQVKIQGSKIQEYFLESR